MLEVGKPATQDGIEVLNDALQAVATRTPRLLADNVLQSRETFLAYGATTTLEAIAEKLKPVTGLPTIPEMGLLGMERQSIGYYPCLHPHQRSFRFLLATAENDKVVRIADDFVPCLSQSHIQRMQVQVGEQRTDYSPNAKGNFGDLACPGVYRELAGRCPEEAPDQTGYNAG